MLDDQFLTKLLCEIVGERPDNDLPCSKCSRYGPVVIVKVGDTIEDVCLDCATKFGIRW